MHVVVHVLGIHGRHFGRNQKNAREQIFAFMQRYDGVDCHLSGLHNMCKPNFYKGETPRIPRGDINE